MSYTFENPFAYFPNPSKSSAVGLGRLYIGLIDVDPVNPLNQVQVYAVQPDGSELAIPQPVVLLAGGVPSYNGSPIQLKINADQMSVKLTTSGGALVAYTARWYAGVTTQDLKNLTVASIKQLRPIDGLQQYAESYVSGTGFGGGGFIYDSTMSWSEHNGGTVIALGAVEAWNGTQGDLPTILNFSGVGSGCYVRQNAGDNKNVTHYGASDGATLALVFEHVQTDSLGMCIYIPDDFSEIESDLRVMVSNVKVKGVQSRKSRLTFKSGYGFYLGLAILSNPNKIGSTKVADITLEDIQITGEFNYSGNLLTLDYCDEVKLIRVRSSPTGNDIASNARCAGLKYNWVQYITTYSCYFGGNLYAWHLNLTKHNQDNEDHLHFFGTLFYSQKKPIAGDLTAGLKVDFANGRSNGPSEVSFNGCQVGEFFDSDIVDLENSYALLVDLKGNTSDKAPMQTWSFNDVMFEQYYNIINTKASQLASTGKDVSIIKLNTCYVVGNSFRTKKFFEADSSKTHLIIDSCTITSVDTVIQSGRVNWQGVSNVTSYNTFAASSISDMDFSSWRPIKGLRTRRRFSQVVTAGATSFTFAHGLLSAPQLVYVQSNTNFIKFRASSITSTDVTVTCDASSGSNYTVYVYVDMQCSQ